MRYYYEMKCRPLDFGTAPDGWVDYIPQASKWGWIGYDRKLSDEEAGKYELALVTESLSEMITRINNKNDPTVCIVKPCPFCGSVMEPGYDSFYLQNLFHPEASCFFSLNMFYHRNLWNLWNQRDYAGMCGGENEPDQK